MDGWMDEQMGMGWEMAMVDDKGEIVHVHPPPGSRNSASSTS